jgi:hypothetical protein
MPVERGKPPDLDCPWLVWDNRRYENGENIDVGFNGHVNLSLDGPALRAEYRDLNCTLQLTEEWRVDVQSGALEGPKLARELQDPNFHFRHSAAPGAAPQENDPGERDRRVSQEK